jgi:hypothetical protein
MVLKGFLAGAASPGPVLAPMPTGGMPPLFADADRRHAAVIRR